MTTTRAIASAFHEAAFVFVDETRDLAIVWNGSLAFRVWTTPGLVNVDQWISIEGVADRWAAREACERWLAMVAEEGG